MCNFICAADLKAGAWGGKRKGLDTLLVRGRRFEKWNQGSKMIIRFERWARDGWATRRDRGKRIFVFDMTNDRPQAGKQTKPPSSRVSAVHHGLTKTTPHASATQTFSSSVSGVARPRPVIGTSKQ